MVNKFVRHYLNRKSDAVVRFGAVAMFVLSAQSQSASADQDSVNLQNFNVDSVRLEGLNTDLDIQTWEKDEVQLRIVNDNPDASAFDASVQGDTLVVSQSANSTGTGSISVVATGDGAESVVNVGGQGVVVTVNGVQITNDAADVAPSPDARLELSVPASTNVDFRAFNGEATIQHLESSLTVAGNGGVDVQSVHNAQLATLGNVSVDVEQVSGDLDLSLEGNSNLEIYAGNIDQLGVRASGNADSSIEASAETAAFDVSNNASVAIRNVVERPSVSVQNNADVDVGNWPGAQ